MGRAKKIAAWPLNKVRRLASLSKNKAKEANRFFQMEKSVISNWSGSSLPGYNALVEVGRSYEEDVDWRLMNPQRRVVELEPGVWSTVISQSSAENINERIQSVHELSQWLRQKDIDFFYMVTPFKVNKYGDFSILHPRFPTQIHFMLPQRGSDITGPLDKVAYQQNQIARKDFYKLNPYAMYGYGDMSILKMENLLLPETDKKVLIIKDSFCDTMGPLLATGVRNIIMVDLRAFTGSLRAYIEECKPNAVFVMYNPADIAAAPINRKTHNDLFDFR